MLIDSLFSGIIGYKFPGAGLVYISQDILFRRPVYYNEPIVIHIEIVEIIWNKRHIILQTQCLDANNNILVDGKAKILFE